MKAFVTVPQWTNRFAVISWSDWLTYDGLAAAPSVTIPTLIVHSDDSAYPDNVRHLTVRRTHLR